MGLAPPEKIQALQPKLYMNAKRESNYLFYALYDKIYRKRPRTLDLCGGWILGQDAREDTSNDQ